MRLHPRPVHVPVPVPVPLQAFPLSSPFPLIHPHFALVCNSSLPPPPAVSLRSFPPTRPAHLSPQPPSRSFLSLPPQPRSSTLISTHMPVRIARNMRRPDPRSPSRSDSTVPDHDRSCRPNSQPIGRTGLAIVVSPRATPAGYQTGYAAQDFFSSTAHPPNRPVFQHRPPQLPSPGITHPTVVRTGYAALQPHSPSHRSQPHRPIHHRSLHAPSTPRPSGPNQPVIARTGYAVLQPRSPPDSRSHIRPAAEHHRPIQPSNGSHANTTHEPTVYQTGYAAVEWSYDSFTDTPNDTRSSGPLPSWQQPSSMNSKSSTQHRSDNTFSDWLADDLSTDLHARLRLSSRQPPVPTAHQRPARNGPCPASRRPLHTQSSTAQEPEPGQVLSASKRRTLARARRDADLRAQLPPFVLHDRAFGAHSVTLCPSAEHPESALGSLIEAVCADGLRLPGDAGPGEVAIAFDMEWVVSRVRGHENRTALVQLAGSDSTLLIQLSRIGLWRKEGEMPEALRALLADRRVVKLGVGIRNDGLKLLRDHKFGPKPFLNSYLELSFLVRAIDRASDQKLDPAESARLISLQKIVADYLEVYLPKSGVRMSDWSGGLSASQLDYAASDVVATVRVSERLFGLLDPRTTSVGELLGSLEPGLPEPEVPLCGYVRREPVVVAATLEEWGLLAPGESIDRAGGGGSDVEQESEAVAVENNQVKHISSRNGQITFAITPRIREAWELWYEQERPTEAVATQMGIKPISVAIYVSKAMIMKKRLLEGVDHEGNQEFKSGNQQNGDEIMEKMGQQKERLREVVEKYGICRRINVGLEDLGL